MDQHQYKFCIQVLRKLRELGVLADTLLIGSWAELFYSAYFDNQKFNQKALHTRDMDFLVPKPGKLHSKVNLSEELKELGFSVDFMGSEGYKRLVHPQIIIEFLVNEKGRGLDKPVELKNWKINAQPLRMLNLLTEETITVEIDGIKVNLPHPVNFALHKVMVSQKRPKKDKAARDLESVKRILNMLRNKGLEHLMEKKMSEIPRTWRKKINKGLGNIK